MLTAVLCMSWFYKGHQAVRRRQAMDSFTVSRSHASDGEDVDEQPVSTGHSPTLQELKECRPENVVNHIQVLSLRVS